MCDFWLLGRRRRLGPFQGGQQLIDAERFEKNRAQTLLATFHNRVCGVVAVSGHQNYACLRLGFAPPQIVTPDMLWETSDE